MDMERLLREVEKRLGGLDAANRAEALDAMREEITRERRRMTLSFTVEAGDPFGTGRVTNARNHGPCVVRHAWRAGESGEDETA